MGPKPLGGPGCTGYHKGMKTRVRSALEITVLAAALFSGLALFPRVIRAAPAGDQVSRALIEKAKVQIDAVRFQLSPSYQTLFKECQDEMLRLRVEARLDQYLDSREESRPITNIWTTFQKDQPEFGANAITLTFVMHDLERMNSSLPEPFQARTVALIEKMRHVRLINGLITNLAGSLSLAEGEYTRNLGGDVDAVKRNAAALRIDLPKGLLENLQTAITRKSIYARIVLL